MRGPSLDRWIPAILERSCPGTEFGLSCDHSLRHSLISERKSSRYNDGDAIGPVRFCGMLERAADSAVALFRSCEDLYYQRRTIKIRSEEMALVSRHPQINAFPSAP